MRAIIYLLGILVKNYRIFPAYLDLIRTEFYDHNQLSQLQERKLRLLIEHARSLSPHYKELLGSIKTHEVTLDSLDQIEIMTKSKLRQINQDIVRSNSLKCGHIKSETSGTSGEAFVFYRDKWWDAYHRAAIYRGMRQFGVAPWEYNVYIWGFIFSKKERIKTNLLDWLQNRSRVFHFATIDQRLNSNLRKAKYISGYSSVINSLAEKSILQKTAYRNIKLVKGTSEKIYPAYKKNTLAAFGAQMVSEYGAAECGIIAFECKSGNMHVQRENVILEVVDGRAVVTNLNSYALPIIRFDLGDYITVEEISCSCGRHGQIVSEVVGRVGKDIIGKNNRYPSLTLYYVFKDLALEDNCELSYSAEQHINGELKLYIYSSRELDETTKQLILSKFDRYFDNDLAIELISADLSDRKEKLKDFRSYIN